MSLYLLFMIFSLVAALLAAFGVSSPKVQLFPLAFALYLIAIMVEGVHITH